MTESAVVYVDVDPITLSTEVVGVILDTWAPIPVTVLLPEGTHRAHIDAIRKVVDHYDPTFVYYQATHLQPHRVYVFLTGTYLTLREGVLTPVTP